MSELKKDNSKLKSRQNDHQVDYKLEVTITERDVDLENQGDVQNTFLSFVDVASSCFGSNMSGWRTLNRPFPLCRLRKNGRLGKAQNMTGFAQFPWQGVMSCPKSNLIWDFGLVSVLTVRQSEASMFDSQSILRFVRKHSVQA